jgi:hypothetical protein
MNVILGCFFAKSVLAFFLILLSILVLINRLFPHFETLI